MSSCNARLTRLELIDFWWNAKLETPQGLNLQELVLMDSEGTAETLLPSSSMTSLQRLHITESDQNAERVIKHQEESHAGDDSRDQELCRLWQVVLGLP